MFQVKTIIFHLNCVPADAAGVADPEADWEYDGVDVALVPARDGGEAEDSLAGQQVDDVEEGEVDEQHVERGSHPRPAWDTR